MSTPKFQIGDRVRKLAGSSWRGRVVGTYSTTPGPECYAVESEREPWPVQIYPAAALEIIEPAAKEEKPWCPDDNPGWTEWAGGDCPVDPGERVAVLLNSRRVYREPGVLTGRAGMWVWDHTGGAGDIIAYRIVDEE